MEDPLEVFFHEVAVGGTADFELEPEVFVLLGVGVEKRLHVAERDLTAILLEGGDVGPLEALVGLRRCCW